VTASPPAARHRSLLSVLPWTSAAGAAALVLLASFVFAIGLVATSSSPGWRRPLDLLEAMSPAIAVALALAVIGFVLGALAALPDHLIRGRLPPLVGELLAVALLTTLVTGPYSALTSPFDGVTPLPHAVEVAVVGIVTALATALVASWHTRREHRRRP